ncbi:hypothetical protein R6Z07F_017100 [Ovis aries]
MGHVQLFLHEEKLPVRKGAAQLPEQDDGSGRPHSATLSPRSALLSLVFCPFYQHGGEGRPSEQGVASHDEPLMSSKGLFHLQASGPRAAALCKADSRIVSVWSKDGGVARERRHSPCTPDSKPSWKFPENSLANTTLSPVHRGGYDAFVIQELVPPTCSGDPGEEHGPAEEDSSPCARRTTVPPRHSWCSWTSPAGLPAWRHPNVCTARTDARSGRVPTVESGVQLESFHHRLAADQLTLARAPLAAACPILILPGIRPSGAAPELSPRAPRPQQDEEGVSSARNRAGGRSEGSLQPCVLRAPARDPQGEWGRGHAHVPAGTPVPAPRLRAAGFPGRPVHM